MTQPDAVPLTVPIARFWRQGPPHAEISGRPGELRGRRRPQGRLLGSPGPDQGYALKLADVALERARLAPHERRSDVRVAMVSLAMRRSSLFGRAPIPEDLLVALAIFGYLMDAPEDLIKLRRGFIDGIGHDYYLQRTLADLIPEELLRLRLHDLTDVVGIWSEWLSNDSTSVQIPGGIDASDATAVQTNAQRTEVVQGDDSGQRASEWNDDEPSS
ncbi:MAG: hypothetical protein ACP5O0_08925 [Acidimicrobiales bacterium]